METKNTKPFPDLVAPLPEGTQVRIPDNPNSDQLLVNLESDGYIFEKDEETGELVAKKRIAVKGNESKL